MQLPETSGGFRRLPEASGGFRRFPEVSEAPIVSGSLFLQAVPCGAPPCELLPACRSLLWLRKPKVECRIRRSRSEICGSFRRPPPNPCSYLKLLVLQNKYPDRRRAPKCNFRRLPEASGDFRRLPEASEAPIVSGSLFLQVVPCGAPPRELLPAVGASCGSESLR